VKGGGHNSNPKFSSTEGLQIAMTRFNSIKYIREDEQLVIGAGCLFDEVYQELERLGVHRNIVGGAASAGVGVGGYYLGGGYSLKTNQYGLGIDTIVAFNVVLPTGNFVEGVTEHSNPELFWALKVSIVSVVHVQNLDRITGRRK
jgi:FAD/FMN-containing dehydrogenase